MSHDAIENLSHEDRAFPPSAEFAAQANATAALYDRGRGRPGRVLGEAGRASCRGRRRGPRRSTGPNAPFAKWFDGGRLNVAVNCVDRHVEAGHGDQVAYHFEGEPGDTRDITYAELLVEVSPGRERARVARRAGRRPRRDLPADDPRGRVAMLACARIGAVHSVVFGGFSAEALRCRIEDAEAVLVITVRRRQPPRASRWRSSPPSTRPSRRRRRSRTCSW